MKYGESITKLFIGMIVAILMCVNLFAFVSWRSASAEIIESESSYYYEMVEYGGPCSTHIDAYYDLYGFTDKEEILAIRERGQDDTFGEFEHYWCSIPGTNYMFYPDNNGAHLQSTKNIYVDGARPGYGYKGNPGAAIDDYVVSASSFTVGNQSYFTNLFGTSPTPTNPNIDRVTGDLGEKADNQDNNTTDYCPDGQPVPAGGPAGCQEYCPNGDPTPEGGLSECSGSEEDTTPSGPTSSEQCQADGGVWKSDIARCVPYQPQTNDCQGTSPTSGEAAGSENYCGILNYIALTINVLAVLAGIVITIAIIAGGIQYSSAGSDPQKVSAARGRIRNAIIALILLVFGYGLLNYLVPGGVI